MRPHVRLGAPIDVETVEAACTRFGPGRLPGADDPEIGAGYAAVSSALLVTVLFVASMALLDLVGWFGSPFGTTTAFFAGVALFAAAFVVPMAFGVGVLVWRLLPSETPYYGAVLGVLGTAGTYLGALLGVYVLQVAAVIGSGTAPTEAFVESAVIAGAIGFFAVVYTGWLAFPVGCASGAVYARVRENAPD